MDTSAAVVLGLFFCALMVIAFLCRVKPRATRITVYFGNLKGECDMDSGTTHVGSKGLRCTALFTDDAGVSDPIYSVPAWSFDTPGSFTSVTPAADGLTCDCAGPITAGTVTGTVTAEGDPTPGKNTLTDTFTIEILPALAAEDTHVGVTFADLT